MWGTIMENLSKRKLRVLSLILLLNLLGCFLIAFRAPNFLTSKSIPRKACLDTNGTAFLTSECKEIDWDNEEEKHHAVSVFEIPRGGLDFSKWDRDLRGALKFDAVGDYQRERFHVILNMDTRLAYSDKTEDGKRTPWKLLARDDLTRRMFCSLYEENVTDPEQNTFNCTSVSLFELDMVQHDYYLLNIRIQRDRKPESETNENDTKDNSTIVNVRNIHLRINYLNESYTEIWFVLKPFFCQITIVMTVWFRIRLFRHHGSTVLLQHMLLFVADSLFFLNFPLDCFSLFYDMPYLWLVEDVRQIVFCSMLLLFWLIFAGEHSALLTHNGKTNSIRRYRKHICLTISGAMLVLIFAVYKRGFRLFNPFHAIWACPINVIITLPLVLYVVFACLAYIKVFHCMVKWNSFKSTTLSKVSKERRSHYKRIFSRLDCLTLVSTVCLGATLNSFLVDRISNENIEFGIEESAFSSVLYMGVYAMWNVYVWALLILYAPSRKQPFPELFTEADEGKVIELNIYNSSISDPSKVEQV